MTNSIQTCPHENWSMVR